MQVINFIGKLLLAVVIGSSTVIGVIAAISVTVHASPVTQENIFFVGAVVLAFYIGCTVVFGGRDAG